MQQNETVDRKGARNMAGKETERRDKAKRTPES